MAKKTKKTLGSLTSFQIKESFKNVKSGETQLTSLKIVEKLNYYAKENQQNDYILAALHAYENENKIEVKADVRHLEEQLDDLKRQMGSMVQMLHQIQQSPAPSAYPFPYGFPPNFNQHHLGGNPNWNSSYPQGNYENSQEITPPSYVEREEPKEEKNIKISNKALQDLAADFL